MVKLRKKAAKGDAVAGSSSGAKVRGWGGARGCAVPKGYGLESVAGWWACSLAATSQTTAQMHGHHEATIWGWIGRAWVASSEFRVQSSEL